MFQFVWIYFADSVCTAIGLPSASRISGCLPSVPWSQRLFSPAPKITLFPYRKRAAPAMCCKNCLYLFAFYFADSVCTAIGLPAAVTTTFSPAPKTIRHASILFPYRKRAAPASACRNCPYVFQFVWIYFADSACTAIDLPSASRISGCLPSVTHSLVTTTFFACSKDGTSYMVCTKMLSMMERRPLAPVFR